MEKDLPDDSHLFDEEEEVFVETEDEGEDVDVYQELLGSYGHSGKPKVKEVTKIARIPRPGYRYGDVKHLSDLVIKHKKGIRYHPSLTTQEGAEKYIGSRKNPEKWVVKKADFDKDPSTPDNVVIFEKKRPKFIDGYTLSTRRPDFLYRAPEWKETFAGYKELKPEESKLRTSQLKNYLVTHSTQESQASESLDKFIKRDTKAKHEHLITKMYLEHTRGMLRTKEGKTKFFEEFGGIQKLPSATLRDLVIQKLKQVEEYKRVIYGDRTRQYRGKVADKLNLIRIIYNSIVHNFKLKKGIEDQKLPNGQIKKVNPTQVQLLELISEEQQSNHYATQFEALLNEYPKKNLIFLPPSQ
jgi:hypothetical protein